MDSTMATTTTTTEHASSGESSSAPAAAPPSRPYGLTPLAMKALGEDGSQVLVCFRSRLILFCGSKALEGNLPVPVSAQLDDIFVDFDPKYHSIIVQQRHRSFSTGGPTSFVKQTVKAAIAQVHSTNSNLSAAGSRRQGVKRERNLQLRDKEGSSGKQPAGKLSSAINVRKSVLLPSLIVIKTAAGHIELHTRNPNSTPKPAKKKKKGFTTGAIFVDWKLSNAALPELALVPSLRTHLPCFYIANPGTSESNHIFGNMAIQQSFLVANTDLESIYRLLYSKDGWLLFQGRKVDSYFDEWYTTLPVFLFNPTTGVRIDLPSICYRGVHAAFCTTTEGTPKVVIFVISRGTTVRVYTVRPGGPCWVEHSYELSHSPDVFMHQMVLCGSLLYCFYKSHSLIFNLEDLSWHPVTPASPYPDFLNYAALEFKGKVVMVSNPEYFNSNRLAHEPMRFFRMEMSEYNCEWVEITGNDEELDGRIWFIDRLQSFSVKVAGSGQKICWFGRKSVMKPGFRYGIACALLCLNLTTRSHRRLIADSVICRQCAWVDLGCLSEHGLLDCGIASDDLIPGF